MTRPVAIVGGGPAGMALPSPCSGKASRPRFSTPARVARPEADQRILALSHGARQILDSLGVWNGIPHTAIATIHISHQGGLGRTRSPPPKSKCPPWATCSPPATWPPAWRRPWRKHGHRRIQRQPPRRRRRPDAPLTVWAEGQVDTDAGGAIDARLRPARGDLYRRRRRGAPRRRLGTLHPGRPGRRCCPAARTTRSC